MKRMQKFCFDSAVLILYNIHITINYKYFVTEILILALILSKKIITIFAVLSCLNCLKQNFAKVNLMLG